MKINVTWNGEHVGETDDWSKIRTFVPQGTPQFSPLNAFTKFEGSPRRKTSTTITYKNGQLVATIAPAA